MATEERITVERLRELLTYDQITGQLSWIARRCNNQAGPIIGGLNDQGYVVLRIDHVAVRAHRVAWALMTGSWPTYQIDHINRIRSDNRWSNLREATHSQNHQNLVVRKDSTHGFRGIELHERGLWRARLAINGKRIHIGYFKTPEEALKAREDAERKYFTHSPLS